MGENASQYFFPSRKWNTVAENLSLEADWLYRTYSLEGEEGGSRTILNFSLYSDHVVYRKVPEKIQLSSEGVEITIPSDHISIVYLDQGKTRYSSWLYSAEADKLMTDASEEIDMILVMDKPLLFTSSVNFVPQIRYFQEVLLGIYQSDK